MSRVLFITVPKAGKNMLFSFFSAVGLPRVDPQRGKALLATYASELVKNAVTGAWPIPASARLLQASMHSAEDDFSNYCDTLMEQPPSCVTSAHFGYHPDLHQKLLKGGVRLIFLYRHPHDILVSMANYLVTGGQPEPLRARLGVNDVPEAMGYFLKGDDQLLAFLPFLRLFTPWISADGVLALRFEDLIGPAGGGNEQAQRGAYAKLVNHCGIELDEEAMWTAIRGAYNTGAGTFYRAQIGSFNRITDTALRSKVTTQLEGIVEEWNYDSAPLPEPDLTQTIGFFQSLVKEKDVDIKNLREALGRTKEGKVASDKLTVKLTEQCFDQATKLKKIGALLLQAKTEAAERQKSLKSVIHGLEKAETEAQINRQAAAKLSEKMLRIQREEKTNREGLTKLMLQARAEALQRQKNVDSLVARLTQAEEESHTHREVAARLGEKLRKVQAEEKANRNELTKQLLQARAESAERQKNLQNVIMRLAKSEGEVKASRNVAAKLTEKLQKIETEGKATREELTRALLRAREEAAERLKNLRELSARLSASQEEGRARQVALNELQARLRKDR